MKLFEETMKQVTQGDVLFTRINKLPKGLKEQERKGPVIVAHSETGHHHQFASPEAKLLEVPNDPFTCYLQLSAPCELQHMRPHDTHESIMFGAGLFEVRRQREYVPGGFRRVED